MYINTYVCVNVHESVLLHEFALKISREFPLWEDVEVLFGVKSNKQRFKQTNYFNIFVKEIIKI